MEYDISEVEAPLPATVAELEALLLQPLSLDKRAAVMTKYIELDQAARAPRAPAAVPTNFCVFIPDNLGTTEIVDGSGRKFQAAAVGDRRCIDITPGVFQILLASPHGEDWRRANETSDVWEKMVPGVHIN